MYMHTSAFEEIASVLFNFVLWVKKNRLACLDSPFFSSLSSNDLLYGAYMIKRIFIGTEASEGGYSNGIEVRTT